MVLPLLPQSPLSLHLHQASLPLTFRITFPSPLRPSRSPEVTTPDSRSGGLNYDLFLFGFTTTTRRYSNPRADSPGSRCPTSPTICQPNTQSCIWHIHGGFPPGGGRGCWDGEAQLAFNLTPATEGVSGLVVFGIISIHKLKPRVNGAEHFFGKRFVYSPGGEYRKLSSQVFFHYGEELNKSSRQTLSFLFHPLNRSFLSGRYKAELESI